ncbi:PREDICTED: protein tamozhennic [Nicrophorus vespilloides]|uniref:Protein tamozhennic n=1 Tax=Nicrophorus vespilloides TaxID=110193 RepID=A0ABM1M3I3_NICVS|nr:PREDICTED: protein tamozhennic [Nicrophorus vespilloides]XP_017769133.1 PREDICTED: protein tamozhennic [Nicrophorus vespilloides]
MVMDKYYQQNQLHELWDKMRALHLSYLQLDECQQKVDQRHKLQECINKFLCQAPHNQKFFMKETSDVLHRSASSKKDFSGYKAALGFNAISMYAANLLSQPWRREYKQIKMYSGYYKHQIESNLLGAETLFEAMGYRQNGQGVLILDEPICPDRLSNVSQDTLVAYVECQILNTIWEEVCAVYNVKWLDVLKFREEYLCSPKQSVNALIYNYHQKQWAVEPSSPLEAPPKYYYHRAVPAPSSPPPPTYIYAAPPPVCYATNYMPHHYQAKYAPPPPVQMVQPQYAYNGVPTAQLIELDACNQPVNQYYDVLEKRMKTLHVADESRKTTPNDDKNSDVNSEGNENWDYVYRNLESKGYYNEMLHSSQPPVEDTKSRRSRNKETLHATYKEKEKKRESYYDNVASPEVATKKKSKSSKTTTSNGNYKEDTVKPQKKTSSSSTTAGWHCTSCTFLNKSEATICEMCNKSRMAPELEEIAVGGSECTNCTYVNAKDKKICDVCGCSLDNSPTYI